MTERFVEEILGYVDAHRAEIMALTKSLDDEWMKRAEGSAEMPLGVEYELRPLPKPVPILVGEVKQEINPRNQRPMTVAIEDSYKPEMMQDYAYFAPTRTVPMARVYVLPADAAFQPIVDKLRQHGITVEETTAPFSDHRLEFRGRSGDQVTQAVSGTQRSEAEGSVRERTVDDRGRSPHRPSRAAARDCSRPTCSNRRATTG